MTTTRIPSQTDSRTCPACGLARDCCGCRNPSNPLSEPTVETHPYRLGMVVYPTLADAEAAKVNAREHFPEAPLPIQDRRTGEVVG